MRQQIFVVNSVVQNMVRKEEFQGEMHYMIASATMPDDIVMNGVLYPKEEIQRAANSINGVHAPLGHPRDDQGNLISATSPYAIRHYGIGAQVVNARYENGRILHDTAINISEAKTRMDRGRRVLDRVEALMSGNNTQPIHTSTGVFFDPVVLPEPQANKYGEYTRIATNMMFDHNAILLDEIGAATPEVGTGMAVNFNGVDVPVFRINEVVAVGGDDIIDQMQEMRRAIRDAIKIKHFSGDDEDVYINEMYDSYVIAEHYRDDQYALYKITYSIGGDSITVGELQKVKRSVVYMATNALKSFIKMIKFAPTIDTNYTGATNTLVNEENEMTPEQMKELLNEQSTTLQANFDAKLALAVQPLESKLAAFEANALAAEKAEKEALITKSGLDATIASEMSVNALKAVVAKIESIDSGEFGERLNVTDFSSNAKDEWADYDINANMGAK
jgi:hypothetical protein